MAKSGKRTGVKILLGILVGMGLFTLGSAALFELKSGVALPLKSVETWVILVLVAPFMGTIMAGLALMPSLMLVFFIKPLKRPTFYLPFMAASAGAGVLLLDWLCPMSEFREAGDELFKASKLHQHEASISSPLNYLAGLLFLLGVSLVCTLKSLRSFFRDKEERKAYKGWAGFMAGLQLLLTAGALGSIAYWSMGVEQDVGLAFKVRAYISGPPAERANLAREFRQTGDERVIRYLARSLAEDKSSAVRLETVQTLAHLAGKREIKVIFKALGDDDPRVAQAALEALSRIRSRSKLSSSERRKWGSKLIGLIKQKHNPHGRRYAAELLMTLGEETTSRLTPLLRKKGERAEVALEILAQVGDENAIRHLLYHLNLPKAETALAALTHRHGVKELIMAAYGRSGPPWPKIKAPVTRVILEMGKPALEPLIEAVSSKKLTSSARAYAFRMVAQLGGPAAADRAAAGLVELLGSEDRRTRDNARYTLIKIKKPAVWALIDGLSSPDETRQIESERVLKRITRRRLGRDAQKWKKWWQRRHPRIVEMPDP